jgi:hypothetical protein
MGLLDDLEKHIYAHFYEIPDKVPREKFAEVAMKLGVSADGLRLVNCLRFSCYDLVLKSPLLVSPRLQTPQSQRSSNSAHEGFFLSGQT